MLSINRRNSGNCRFSVTEFRQSRILGQMPYVFVLGQMPYACVDEPRFARGERHYLPSTYTLHKHINTQTPKLQNLPQ